MEKEGALKRLFYFVIIVQEVGNNESIHLTASADRGPGSRG